MCYTFSFPPSLPPPAYATPLQCPGTPLQRKGSTVTTKEKEYKQLSETTAEERMTPIEQQINPSLAAAVESEEGYDNDPANDESDPSTKGINRNVDSVAAREDVPDFRTPGQEVVAPEEHVGPKNTESEDDDAPAKTPAKK
jgi:hypothetical protein